MPPENYEAGPETDAPHAATPAYTRWMCRACRRWNPPTTDVCRDCGVTRDDEAPATAPATLYDKRGIPIEPGDLLKTFHLKDYRRRNHWLYHVAVKEGDRLRMVPVSHLDKSMHREGGDPLLNQGLADEAEIVSGYGPGECFTFHDRPRRKPETR